MAQRDLSKVTEFNSRKEFHGFRMAGMIVEVKLAESELPIVPRSQRRNEVGMPRYFRDVWQFPEEAGREGMQIDDFFFS